MKKVLSYILFLGFLLLQSCTKTEVVSGMYYGTASGYPCGTNVDSYITITRVDDEMVNIECDFYGLQKHFHNVSVFKGNEQYFISDGKGMIAVIRGSELTFQYTDKTNNLHNIVFYGNHL